MTDKEAITYANILNRLYSKDFRAYTRARLNTPSKYEIKKLVRAAKAECEHQAKIRHDALVQELFDLAHHTRLREHVNKKGVSGSCRVGYTTTITPTAAQKRVKRLASETQKRVKRLANGGSSYVYELPSLAHFCAAFTHFCAALANLFTRFCAAVGVIVVV